MNHTVKELKAIARRHEKLKKIYDDQVAAHMTALHEKDRYKRFCDLLHAQTITAIQEGKPLNKAEILVSFARLWA